MRMVETGLLYPNTAWVSEPLKPWIVGYTQRRSPSSWSSANLRSLDAVLTLTAHQVVPFHP